MRIRTAQLCMLVALALTCATLSGDEPDYNKAKWDEIHRAPSINQASNQDCLKCHTEILEHKPRDTSLAGLKKSEVLAWYQTLDTYEGEQQSFHWRHLESPYAKKVMDLKCNFCHQGNDPREEAPSAPTGKQTGFTLRKMVDVKETCLKCHGQMNWKVMTLPSPLPGPWTECRDKYQNDCLSCHAVYRTVRHQVNYLKADNIEELAKPTNIGGDVCYGCHGGRAWYRKGYEYPRHAYPGMDKIPDPHPEWAKGRATKSDPRYALPLSTLLLLKKPASSGEAAGGEPAEGDTAASVVESKDTAAPQAAQSGSSAPTASSDKVEQQPANDSRATETRSSASGAKE